MSDEPARRTIATVLDRTLFVEAGAGTGKTTALVGRIVELVTTGRCPVGELAAITFTEAAAAELRDRIRLDLEEAASDQRRDDDARQRAAAGLAELDAAAISTLHGFAQRILTEHPLEAGLPPRLDVQDELAATLAFGDRWALFLDELLSDPSEEPAVTRALVAGVRPDDLRQIARTFTDNWDLLEQWPAVAPAIPTADRRGVLEPLEAALARRGECTAEDDRLLAHLDKLAGFARRLSATTDDLEAVRLLLDVGRLSAGKTGQKGCWSDIDGVRDLLEAAEAARTRTLGAVRGAAIERLLVRLRRFVLDGAEHRRREGSLEFHDLLVLARRLLRHRPDVAARLAQRYRCLLIDEFQDTDPIQLELAVRIANGGVGAAPDGDWTELEFEPGRLFFVGDAKQAIYRFRRADIRLFLEARARLGGELQALTRNFRSVPGVLDWVNAVFGDLLGAGEDDRQPAYEPLRPVRTAHPGPVPVVLLGVAHDDATADEVRAAEGDELAALIRHAVDQGWPVGDDSRPARLGDVVVLLPQRTALAAVEDAFDRGGIPYRVQSSGLVYATREVGDLLAVLHAVDDPTDDVNVVHALRSGGLACRDADLLTWHQAGGRWDHTRPRPDAIDEDHPVARAMALLAELHEARWWTDVSGLVERVITDLGLYELGTAHRRARDVWRRLRFIADQARAWADAAGGDLRGFLAWIDAQRERSSNAVESILPETDDDSVQIMTVHAAKGLQFPITVVAGLDTAPNDPALRVRWHPDGRPEVKLRAGVETAGFAALDADERNMADHERLRLLYVAATRARDHLVVSVHRKATNGNSRATSAAVLAGAAARHPDTWRPAGVAGGQPLPPALPPPASIDRAGLVDAEVARDERARWLAARAERLAAAADGPTVSATALAKLAAERAAATADLAPTGEDPVDHDRPPWRRGRAGTAIGRAVHGTLQTIDLATGHDVRPTAAAQAAAEGVPARAGEVARLVEAARGSATVQAAVASGRLWREVYVACPVEGTVIEGFIDLLYERDDGLVVVDYKTDAVAEEADVDAALDRYRLQGASYAAVLEASLGRSVAECRFVFLRGTEVRERSVADLAGAVAEVRALLAARTSDRVPAG